MPTPAGSLPELPYRLACLCDLRDAQGRVLLLHRAKAPNQGLFSPIGGKLDVATGESPAQCAQREIKEEVGLDIPISRLHLLGLVAETAFEGRAHWLMFVYRVMGPVWVEPFEMREGKLDWYHPRDVDGLALPETDRKIIWPLTQKVEQKTPGGRPGFYSLHIDCRPLLGKESMIWTVDQLIEGT
ncbi:MAG: NUDIX domain-containing protein [Planctomycetes bacterium]|nr:NUDIX domain-containing protein [Planctomycetota bacterium]